MKIIILLFTIMMISCNVYANKGRENLEYVEQKGVLSFNEADYISHLKVGDLDEKVVGLIDMIQYDVVEIKLTEKSVVEIKDGYLTITKGEVDQRGGQ